MSGSGPYAPPSGDPFGGGSQFRVAPPPSVGGTLAPATTGVVDPLAGVQASAVKRARHNSGSNIRIPYARLVPVSDIATALPTYGGFEAFSNNSTDVSSISSLHYETESSKLAPGRIAFIKGKRAITSTASVNTSVDIPGFKPSTVENTFSDRRKYSGHDVNRFQRLCSFEYLERLFAVMFRRVHLDLSATTNGADLSSIVDNNGNASGLIKMFQNSNLRAKNLGSVGDVAREFTKPPAAAHTVNPEITQGLFVRDVHPFLRGRGAMNEIVKDDKKKFSLPRCLGDQTAFAILNAWMDSRGMMDWRPDGIVVGKDHAGPDEASDKEYDARLGQLFNVAIQGPAITTNYAGNHKLTCMPGDRVFVLVLCDVVFQDKDGTKLIASDLLRGGDNVKPYDLAFTKPGLSPEEESDMRQAREERLNQSFDWNSFKSKYEEGLDNLNAGKNTLCNFRLRLSTSAEMIHYSGVSVETNDSMETYKVEVKKAVAKPSFETAMDDDTILGMCSKLGVETGKRDKDALIVEIEKEVDGFPNDVETSKFAQSLDIDPEALDKAQLVADIKTEVNTLDLDNARLAAQKLSIEPAEKDVATLQAEIDGEVDDLVALEDVRAFAADIGVMINAKGRTQLVNEIKKKLTTLDTNKIIELAFGTFSITPYTKTKSQWVAGINLKTGGEFVSAYTKSPAVITLIRKLGIAPIVDKIKAPDYSKGERMGLRLTSQLGEYIVGGWCIGTVTDAAASRAALPGQFATKSDPSTYAWNVHVNVEWWTGDRLYRSFCNVENRLRSRFIQSSTDAYILEGSQPANKRSGSNYK